MRNPLLLASGLIAATLVSGCGHRGYDRARPDEFAVARQAPLVIPPDFALVPPAPGAARPQDTAGNSQAQTLDALFGGRSQRSASEAATVDAAGGDSADDSVRSTVGDPGTTVVNKGSTTRDIVAAPQGDGQSARASAQ